MKDPRKSTRDALNERMRKNPPRTRIDADANRPQAKTAARKAFDREYGFTDDTQYQRDIWLAFQLGWRLARGAKPTVREKDV